MNAKHAKPPAVNPSELSKGADQPPSNLPDPEKKARKKVRPRKPHKTGRPPLGTAS